MTSQVHLDRPHEAIAGVSLDGPSNPTGRRPDRRRAPCLCGGLSLRRVVRHPIGRGGLVPHRRDTEGGRQP